MDIIIQPGTLHGTVPAIPSKSQAHRLLICASFADRETVLHCDQTNQDIEATVDCLRALGAGIVRTQDGYRIRPISRYPGSAALNCRESGSTLRFLLPVVGAMGIDCIFQLSGRLPCRPLSPLWEELQRMGCSLSRPTHATIACSGQLRAGGFSISGAVSSQYISGLLFAMALLPGKSHLQITDTIESAPYISMTQQALEIFGVQAKDFSVVGGSPLRSPEQIAVEGDWSNAAFFVAAQALGSSLEITNLNMHSPQGDRAVSALCDQLQEYCVISAKDIPDLIPILSVVAACRRGAVFTDIQRLRLKESDRVASVVAMINALGGRAEATQSDLMVYGTGLKGGTVCSENDHRIAMAAGIAATAAKDPIIIRNAECVSKSYPAFWSEYRRLGGQYEQYIR